LNKIKGNGGYCHLSFVKVSKIVTERKRVRFISTNLLNLPSDRETAEDTDTNGKENDRPDDSRWNLLNYTESRE